jgi:DNA primase
MFCASQQCFGEKGADAFALVMLMSECTFPEALDKLADHYGISTSPPGEPAARPRSATRSASAEHVPTSKKSITADEIRQGLLREGYHAAAEFLFRVDLRKVRFEHESLLQEDKRRAAK